MILQRFFGIDVDKFSSLILITSAVIPSTYIYRMYVCTPLRKEKKIKIQKIRTTPGKCDAEAWLLPLETWSVPGKHPLALSYLSAGWLPVSLALISAVDAQKVCNKGAPFT